MGKKDKRKAKGDKPKAKQAKFNAKKLSALAKRYWYWLVVIPLLIVAIILFCYFQGYFEPKNDVELLTSVSTDISFPIGFDYNMDVVASNGSQVSYKIKEGYDEIVTIKGNVIKAIKPGNTKIVASAGDKSKTFNINVSQVILSWVIPIGEKVETDVINQFVEKSFDLGSYITNYDFGGVVDFETDSINDKRYIVGKKEGIAIIEIISDKSDASNGAIFAMISIKVKENLKEEDIVIEKDISVKVSEDAKIDYTNIHEAHDIEVYQDILISDMDIKFDKSGIIYYYQRPTDVLSITEYGLCKANKEGDGIVTVICLSEDGTYAYANVKIRVHPMRIQRQGFVGVEISTAQLLMEYDNSTIAYYDTDSDYLEVFNSPDGYAESFTPTKGNESVTIYGYDADGNRIVEFVIDILPADEYMGEEE